MNKTKIVLDADVIIHFSKGGLLHLLPKILPEFQFIVLDIVKDELPASISAELDNQIRWMHNISEEIFGNTYEERRIMYNDGDLTSEKPERAKSRTQLQRNKPIEKKLIRLSQTYNDNAIKHAFAAYTDSVFKEEKSPENFMGYFLSYDDTTDSFGVFEYYLNYFNLNYGYKNK